LAATKTRGRVTAGQIQKVRDSVSKNKKIQPSVWQDAETWSGEQFSRVFRREMSEFNLNYSSRELKPKIIDWMGRNDYSRADIARFKKTKDWRCGITMGAIASCLLKGMPTSHSGFNQGKSSELWLRKEIQRVIDEGQEDVELVPLTTKSLKPEITIQDRLKEQAGSISEEFDLAVDRWITDPDGFDPKEFKVSSLLRTKNAKAAHARYIKTFYTRDYNTLLELASGNADDQLKENYKAYARKNIRKLIEFYESIMTACDQISAEAKVLKKPRVKKTKSADELVKKLKFKVSEDKLGIASVPPTQIVGAQGLVVYNVKTRKIYYVISKSSEGLGVKGTLLTNFSEMSVQKTLRKPVEQLKEFKEQNTLKRFELWFSKIKTTDTKFSGRLNEDCIILKAFK
jgi:hypothetical protein